MTFWLITQRDLGRATQGGPGALRYASYSPDPGWGTGLSDGEGGKRGFPDMSGRAGLGLGLA